MLGRILDDFWGRFLFIFNVAFSFSGQLGHFHTERSGHWRKFLIGIITLKHTPYYMDLFYKLQLVLLMGLCLLSCIVIVIRKMIEHYKEKNLVQSININLGPNQHLFNTSKYNKSILSTLSMVLFFVFMLFGVLFNRLTNRKYEEGGMSDYKYSLFYWQILSPILRKILFTFIILSTNPDMCKFIFKTIREFVNFKNPPYSVCV